MGANVGALGLNVGSSVGANVGFRVGLNVGLYVGTRVPSSTKILISASSQLPNRLHAM